MGKSELPADDVGGEAVGVVGAGADGSPLAKVEDLDKPGVHGVAGRAEAAAQANGTLLGRWLSVTVCN